MDFDLIARARLREVTNRFATCADRNEAIKGMRMLTETFKYGPDGDLKPKGALANMLMMRQVFEYQTRHHAFEPMMTEMSETRIAGVVPIASTKVEDGKMTYSVNEFHVTIVQVDGEWKIDRLNMVPFASTTMGLA
jgi:hypothetical protein